MIAVPSPTAACENDLAHPVRAYGQYRHGATVVEPECIAFAAMIFTSIAVVLRRPC
jgi:hypothetical protein